MNENERYKQYAADYSARFQAFKRVYETTHPKPAGMTITLVDALLLTGLIVMLGASVVVSGGHTISIIGVPGFLMIEVGLVTLAFWRAYTETQRGDQQAGGKRITIRSLILFGLLIAFAVALSSNVVDSLRSTNLYVDPNIATALRLVLAASAPLMTFIVGEIIGQFITEKARHVKASSERYQAELVNAWNSNKARWQVSAPAFSEQPMNRSVNGANERTERTLAPVNEQSEHSPNGKNMNAREHIERYFAAHPERINSPLNYLVNEIEQFTGERIGRTTIHNVRSELKQKGGQDE